MCKQQIVQSRLMKRYQLLKKLGQGGMGTVYKVKEKKTGATFALKILNIEKSPLTKEEQLLRFKREFRTLASLEHPNLIKVHNFGQMDGKYFFTMDYFEGNDIL